MFGPTITDMQNKCCGDIYDIYTIQSQYTKEIRWQKILGIAHWSPILFPLLWGRFEDARRGVWGRKAPNCKDIKINTAICLHASMSLPSDSVQQDWSTRQASSERLFWYCLQNEETFEERSACREEGKALPELKEAFLLEALLHGTVKEPKTVPWRNER